MSEVYGPYFEAFPAWLRGLAEDVEELTGLLDDTSLNDEARESVAGGLNYLFKSLDLIPDGVEHLGYLDDCFVVRIAAELALNAAEDASTDALRVLGRLANDAEVIHDFLDSDTSRLVTYVKTLRRGAARGRSVNDILTDEDTRAEFVQDVKAFSQGYRNPGFPPEEKSLVKLKAFLDAKLPK
jgi:uncharacterized membrane protein YkvA (DUF1232 family)